MMGTIHTDMAPTLSRHQPSCAPLSAVVVSRTVTGCMAFTIHAHKPTQDSTGKRNKHLCGINAFFGSTHCVIVCKKFKFDIFMHRG